MKNTPKQPKSPGLIKRFFAPNLVSLINHRYAHLDNKTARALALEKDSKVGKNTIIRACDPDDSTAITLDNIERLATALNVFPYQLLIPYLDVKNPQIIISPSDEERKSYKSILDAKGK